MLRITPLFLLIFLLSCKSQEETPQKSKSKKAIEVSVITPQKEKVRIYYTTRGSFKAIKEVTLRPEVSGIVKNIFSEEGESVKKGEKLLKIEDKFLKLELERLNASYSKLLADLEYYRTFYERRKRLYERELISREAYEEARKRLKTYQEEMRALKAQIENIKLKIERSVVRAPFDGFIANRFVSEGDYVTPSAKLFQIVSLNPIRLSFSIPQEYLPKVKRGALLLVEVEGIGTISGKVSFISPVLSKDRTLTVNADFQNKDGKIKPGMYAFVKVLIGEMEAIKIPEKALTIMGNKKIVWKIEKGRAVPVEVKLLKIKEGYAYVTGNITEGDKIAVENVHLLIPNAKVKLK